MTIDKTKPALGYEIERTAASFQAIAVATLGDDLGPPGLLRNPEGQWPDGERDHATEAEAVAASHRYREEFVRPDVVAFAEGVLAFLRDGDPATPPVRSPVAWNQWLAAGGPGKYLEWRDAQILAAARGERKLP